MARSADVTPPGFNVRTRVHEYGGGAYTVDDGTIYFSNFADQRIYRQQPGKAPVAITDDGSVLRRLPRRSISQSADRRARDTRDGQRAKNDLVAIGTPTGVPAQVLVEGADFYSDPIVSPDGKFLAWLQWHHPNMPWDGTELWVAVFNADGSVGVAREGRRRQRANRSSSRSGRPTARCTSSRIAPAGGTCIAGAALDDRGRAPDGGGVRQAAVDVQHGHLCVRRRESHRGDLHRGRALEAGADRRRRRDASTPLDLPLEPLESIKANARRRSISSADRRPRRPAIVALCRSARRQLQRAAIVGDAIRSRARGSRCPRR